MISRVGVPTFLALALCVLLSVPAEAGCVKRPLTGGEQAFYRQVTNVADKAMPAPEGWRRIVSQMNVPDTVCEGFEDKPIPYMAQYQFKRILESERIQEAMDQRYQEHQDKAMAAYKRGDSAEADRIMARLQEENAVDMDRLLKARQKETAGPKPIPITAKLKVNDKRKVIGKKFDVKAIPHTAKTFETVNSLGTERERISKILLIGNWRVEDFMKNWNLFRPEAPYDVIGGIHLVISGKREDVETYVSGTADLGLLAGAAR